MKIVSSFGLLGTCGTGTTAPSINREWHLVIILQGFTLAHSLPFQCSQLEGLAQGKSLVALAYNLAYSMYIVFTYSYTVHSTKIQSLDFPREPSPTDSLPRIYILICILHDHVHR